MTKGQITETVFIAVNGGVPSTDSVVMREDISALLPAAINYAITGDYWGNIQRDNDREIPNNFITEFSITDIKSENGKEFVEFGNKIVNYPGNTGIRYVQDHFGNSYAPRAAGTSSMGYWDKAFTDNKEHQFADGKIFLYGRPSMTKTILVGVVLDASELSDEDELPIPAGSEPQVIDMLIGFFKDQRMQPKDYVINSVDPVNEVR